MSVVGTLALDRGTYACAVPLRKGKILIDRVSLAHLRCGGGHLPPLAELRAFEAAARHLTSSLRPRNSG